MSDKGGLAVINTAPEPRRGVVVARWDAIRTALGIGAGPVRIFDGDRRLDAQIDRIDPADPAQDELAIFLDHDVPVAEHALSLRVEAAGEIDDAETEAIASVFAGGVKLHNAALTLWLNCTPDRQGWGNWFAGAVTSVELQGQELLNFVASRYALPPDQETRCMQVDRLQIPRPPWHDAPFAEPRLFDQPWRVISQTQGPVRATVTIASSPFLLETSASLGVDAECFTCSLLRTISLNAGADWVRDTMRLSASGPELAAESAFWFSPHYFMFADFGLLATLKQPRPDRLIVGADSQPPYGYAIAANVAVDEVRNPPIDFPDHDREHRAFAWKLGFARRIEALHLFSLDTPQALADAVGVLWYDQLHNPLRLAVR